MSNGQRKHLRGHRPRLELLETRALLSAVAIGARPAAEISPLVAKPKGETITGSLSGHGVSSTGSLLQGNESLTATGTATGLGTVSFDASLSYKAVLKHKIVTGFKFTKGAGTLFDNSGDSISVSFNGSAVSAGGFTYDTKFSGPVKSGTGSFSKPSGTFVSKGTLNLVTGAFTVTSYTVHLKRV